MRMQPMVIGHHYMASAGQYLATEAAHAILRAGGNAIDAGVAGGIALGVVHSDQVQFSGVAPMLIHLADRNETVSIAGLGWWPKALNIETFIRDHNGTIPVGLQRTVVPAAPDAWILALQRYGTMSFGEVAAAAIRYARDGFAVHTVMATFLQDKAEDYRRWPQNVAIWQRDGKPLAEGDRLVQADLGRTIQFMADQEKAAAGRGRDAGLAAARDAFYRGDIAQTIAKYHRENGGLLTQEDLAEYRSEIEAPLRYTYKGTDVLSCGPWCQGPVLLQMLSLLDEVDLEALGHNSKDYVHLLAEVMGLCFADRERYYGDPRFVDVPMETLLSRAYAQERLKTIRHDRAFGEMPPAGAVAGHVAGHTRKPSVAVGEPGLPGDTSYVCVVDSQGNAFSATPSDVSWESPVIPGLGLCPSSRGSQSWADPGPHLRRRTRQAAEAHAQSGDGDAQGRVPDAVRLAGRRPAAAGHAAGAPKSSGLRHGYPAGGRGAALHHPQLPRQFRAAHLLSRPPRRRAGDRQADRRCARRHGPPGELAARSLAQDRRRLRHLRRP